MRLDAKELVHALKMVYAIRGKIPAAIITSDGATRVERYNDDVVAWVNISVEDPFRATVGRNVMARIPSKAEYVDLSHDLIATESGAAKIYLYGAPESKSIVPRQHFAAIDKSTLLKGLKSVEFLPSATQRADMNYVYVYFDDNVTFRAVTREIAATCVVKAEGIGYRGKVPIHANAIPFIVMMGDIIYMHDEEDRIVLSDGVACIMYDKRNLKIEGLEYTFPDRKYPIVASALSDGIRFIDERFLKMSFSANGLVLHMDNNKMTVDARDYGNEITFAVQSRLVLKILGRLGNCDMQISDPGHVALFTKGDMSIILMGANLI